MARNSKQNDSSVPNPSVPVSEMLKTIPEFFGIRVNEEPRNEVLEKSGDFEIRRYEARWIAEVRGDEKDFDTFRENAFRRLAHFIFGGNQSEKKMAMTAPVVIELAPSANDLEVRSLFPEIGASAWSMSFVLPAALKQGDIPKPEDSRIQTRRAPAQDFAVHQYSGNNTPEKIKEAETKLNAWLRERQDLRSLGGYLVAQYDAPFVIPLVKRNEVMIAVKRMQ